MSKDNYGAVKITVLDTTPAGKRKTLHDQHVDGIKKDLEKRITIAEKVIYAEIAKALETPPDKIQRNIKIGSAREKTPAFHVLWKAASHFYPWQVELDHGKHGFDDIYLTISDEINIDDDSNGIRKRTVAWWMEEYGEFANAETKERVKKNIETHVKYETMFEKVVEEKSKKVEKEIVDILEKIVALPANEIPRIIKAGTANTPLDYEILADVASRFFPWQAKSRNNGDGTKTMFLVMPNLGKLDIELDITDVINERRIIITAADWFAAYVKKKGDSGIQSKRVNRIIDLYVKYESRYAEKMQTFEDDLTTRLDAGISKALQINSSRFLIKALEIPASEYADGDKRVALAFALKNNFPDWILYRVIHIKGIECCRDGSNECGKGCVYAHIIAPKWKDCVRENIWETIDFGDEEMKEEEEKEISPIEDAGKEKDGGELESQN